MPRAQSSSYRVLSPLCRRLSSERGSLLIVALLLAAAIGISLVSYLRLATTALRTADRSFYANSSVDLAECGVEQAMACFYQVTNAVAAATAWSGWTLSGANATRIFTDFTPGPNATGVVRVYVQNYAMTSTPLIVAKATITPPSGPTIEKFLEVTVTPRTLGAMGMVARTSITFSGSPTFDSWKSDADNNPATPGVPYSTSGPDNRTANIHIGVDSSVSNAISLGHGHVDGYIHNKGSVANPTPTISKASDAVLTGNVTATTGWDTTRITNDFSATFIVPTVPAHSVEIAINSDPPTGTSFPRAGDIAASDGKYYYSFNVSAANITNSITVAGKCVFILNNHLGAVAIRTTATVSHTISAGATFELYTNGNITSSGGGYINGNLDPATCSFYGTSVTTQTVAMSGTSATRAVFYFPNAAFTISGSSDFYGSLVANTINGSADTRFHFDESLGGAIATAGVHVTKWRELQSSLERQTYSTQLNFL